MESDFVSADRLNGEFELYLQSVVFASDFTVSGAELLVRWHMPAGEIIPVNKIESAECLWSATREICR